MNKKLKIQILLAVAVVAAVSFAYFHLRQSLQLNTIDNQISHYIKQNCKVIETCKVTLSDFTNFEWDTFYFVSTAASLDNPNYNVSFDFPKDHGFGNSAFVFMNKGKTVYFEKLPYDTEFIPPGSVLVSYPIDDYIKKSDAIFTVEAKKDKGEYYNLQLVSTSSAALSGTGM